MHTNYIKITTTIKVPEDHDAEACEPLAGAVDAIVSEHTAKLAAALKEVDPHVEVDVQVQK